jgi:signal transduction histidine kinase
MASLRSRLILASILWTSGLLLLMHLLTMLYRHMMPRMRGDHSGIVIPVGIGLMIAGFLIARGSLTPFRQLRHRLNVVRSGRDLKVTGDYPTEIRPLVDELNALLESRDQSIRRALATAGDLAHGLKTPLALLRQDAGRLRAEGHAAAADSLSEQIDRMDRQVDYHLARARAASSSASGNARTSVAEAAEALIRTVRKLHAARSLEISTSVAPDHFVRLQREDFDEILGNLLDNACKWASRRIAVTSSTANGSLTLVIDDDGPGLAPELRNTVLERGVRADQAASGSGLGLAIVRDLVEVYDGAIALEDSPLGGLRVRLTLPCTP